MSTHFVRPAVWHPRPEYIEASNLTAFMTAEGLASYEDLRLRADSDPAWFWDAVVRHFHIRFSTPYERVLDLADGPARARWFPEGTLNLTWNCVESHRTGQRMNAPAIIWEGEDGEIQSWSFAKLDAETCRLAEGLRGLGIGHGDVVALFMPMGPAAAAALLAIAKIGAITLPLYSGFGARAMADRLRDSGTRAIVTADGTHRRGRIFRLKEIVDSAVRSVPSLTHIVVHDSLGLNIPWNGRRDHWWQDFLPVAPAASTAEPVSADHPFMLLYTSGSAALAKGTVHTHGGFLAKLVADFGLSLDLKASDRMLWITDVGWLAGIAQIVAASFFGATLVIGEGAPDFPDKGRLWRLVQDHAVTFLGVTPSMVRRLMAHGVSQAARYDLGSLRIATSTGEAWDPAAWIWFFEHVCHRRVPLLDVSGGTEVGWGILGSTVLHTLLPCAFATHLPGMAADVVGEQGKALPPGRMGELVLRQPSPGMSRGLWNDEARYLSNYWGRFHDIWVHGDWASRDEQGYWHLHGRSDDTIIVAGHRCGPGEIEAVLVESGLVAEAVAVGIGDAMNGQSIACACVPHPDLLLDLVDGDEWAVTESLRDKVAESLGAIFRPRQIVLVSQLPKTPHWTVVRRIVRAAFENRALDERPLLVNPEAVGELQAKVAETGRRT